MGEQGYFFQPEYGWVLGCVPLVLVLVLLEWRRADSRLAKLLHRQNLQRLVPQRSRARWWWCSLCMLVAVGLIGLGIMRPRYGFEWQDVNRKGVDIVIALDVSSSMLAEDISPNRLKRAGREIQDLLDMLQGDRVALVAFAGVGFVQCPLTLDYQAVRLYLNHLDSDLIPVPGTSIGAAIRLGLKSFKDAGSDGSEGAGRAIILITDGEDQGSEPLAAAREAAAAGVKVFTIGMGADDGAPIPLKEGGFKKDNQGNLVVSKLDEATLQQIATITTGDYVRSTSGDLDLERIYLEGIKGGDLKETEIESSRRKIFHERTHLFSAAAAVTLFFALL